MEVISLPIEKIKPSDYNPRDIAKRNYTGLKNSHTRFGTVLPVVWNKRTGHIVGGHQSYKIQTEQGKKEILVSVVDLTEAEERALNLALNNPNIQGEFIENVDDLIASIKEDRVDLFDELLLGDIKVEKVLEEIEEAKENPITEKRIKDMELQPFESYDYCVVLCKTTQDWYWLSEFLKLENVNASQVGSKKIGLGRAISVDQLKRALNEFQNSNTKSE